MSLTFKQAEATTVALLVSERLSWLLDHNSAAVYPSLKVCWLQTTRDFIAAEDGFDVDGRVCWQRPHIHICSRPDSMLISMF